MIYYSIILNKVFKPSPTKKIKMGWLFGKKKKVPKVPLPEGHALDPGSLKFPSRLASERIIEPEQLKEAVGFEKPVAPTMPTEEMPARDSEPLPQMPFPTEPVQQRPLSPMNTEKEPLYIKVDVYQRILAEIDDLKSNVSALNDTNRKLENSEFNEEANFEKLRRIVKLMHDRLLQVDKALFKSQGE